MVYRLGSMSASLIELSAKKKENVNVKISTARPLNSEPVALVTGTLSIKSA